jgi:hypothetical protein
MNIIFKYGYSSRQLIIRYLPIKLLRLALFFTLVLLINSCIEQFIPETTVNQNLLVVEGLITDQPGQNTIKVSTSMPLGVQSSPQPLTGCTVSISDDKSSSKVFNRKYRIDQTLKVFRIY